MKTNNNPLSLRLGSRLIDSSSYPYIIAEIGVNHEGSLDTAKMLIDHAKEGGAHAVKFQTYKAEKLASKHSPAYWDTSKEHTKSQFELFKKYDKFGENEYLSLYAYCKQVDIDFLSTPFDDAAIDFLEPIVPFFKIASADITNIPFLRKIGDTSKPVVLSTGASKISEIDLAVKTLKDSGAKELSLLHCILNYPTPDACAHLNMISSLSKAYPELLIGYSDHTLPDESMTTLITAYLLGAVVIEKHFTHDKTLPGNDHYHAMDRQDLLRFNQMIAKVRNLQGDINDKQPIETEKLSRLNARRSIVAASDLSAGHVLCEHDLTYKRPGHGISPLHWDTIIGKTLLSDIQEDSLLSWDDIDH